jgi:hypothetical protein
MVMCRRHDPRFADEQHFNRTARVTCAAGRVDSAAQRDCRAARATRRRTDGSIDQYGVVQAIGGVNDKIEGMFALCAERGLRGGEGVIIPAADARNLMLHHDVAQAVEQRRFTCGQ